MSKIEWTGRTWNPVTGCTRASSGCDNCYAVTMTHRLAGMGQTKTVDLRVREMPRTETEVANALTRLISELSYWQGEAKIAKTTAISLERLLMTEREQAEVTIKSLRCENRKLRDNLRYYCDERKAKRARVL